MPPLLHDLAVIDDQYLIGVFDGLEPVRDHDDGLAAGQRFNGPLQPILVLRIDVGGGLVENDDGRILQLAPPSPITVS